MLLWYLVMQHLYFHFFVHLTSCDRRDLEIDLSDAEIGDMSKNMWKKYIKETVKSAALKCLVNENYTKEKTKGIKISSLGLSEYLRKNMKKSVSQIIFSTRSKTLEIKQWAHGSLPTICVLNVDYYQKQ